jgi:phenylalanyl-tRNA synthetase beta subunit
LLAFIPKNRPFCRSFRLFEIGREFFACDKDDCVEFSGLAGIAFQRAGSLEELYFSVKSAVEGILKTCEVQNVQFTPGSIHNEAETPYWKPWWSEGHFVEIRTNSILLGRLGILDKDLTIKVCRAGGQIAWFDIHLHSLDEEHIHSVVHRPEIKFEEPPTNPLSWMDFSLLWGIGNDFAKLESLLDGFENPLFIRREFLESYKGKGLDKGMACYSFRFWIGSSDHTLSGEEIESFHQQFLTYIRQHNIVLRT